MFVELLSCTRFPAKDPCVKFFSPVDSDVPVFVSSVKKNNPNPTWHDEGVLLANCNENLRVACFDHRGDSDVFIGSVVINSSEFAAGQYEARVLACTIHLNFCKPHHGLISPSQNPSSDVIVVHVGSICIQSNNFGEVVLRAVYAGSTVGEFACKPNVQLDVAFSIHPVGGNLGCTLSLWNSTPKFVGSAVIDLRTDCQSQQFVCEDSAEQVTFLASVQHNAEHQMERHNESNQLLSVTNVDWQCQVIPTEWYVLAIDSRGNQKSLNLSLCCPACFFLVCGNTKLTLVSDATGALTAAIESGQNRLHFSDSAGPVASLSFCLTAVEDLQNVPLPAEKSLLSLVPPSEHLSRNGQRCCVNFTVEETVFGGPAIAKLLDPSKLFDAGEVSVSCGSVCMFSLPKRISLPFAKIGNSCQITCDQTSRVVLVLCSLWNGTVTAMAEFSPYDRVAQGNEWFPLMFHGETLGYILITWKTTFLGDSSTFHSQNSRALRGWTHATFEIVEACDIIGTDLGGSCDAYCVVQQLPLDSSTEHRHTTAAVQNGNNPVWNSSFSTMIRPEVVQGFVFFVLDKEFQGADNFIGMTVVRSDSFVWMKESGEAWFPLSTRETAGQSSTGGEHLKATCCKLRLRWKFEREIDVKAGGESTHGSAQSVVPFLTSGSCKVHFERFSLMHPVSTVFAKGSQLNLRISSGGVLVRTLNCSGDVTSRLLKFDGDALLTSQNLSTIDGASGILVELCSDDAVVATGTVSLQSLACGPVQQLLIEMRELSSAIPVFPLPLLTAFAQVLQTERSEQRLWTKPLEGSSLLKLRLKQFRGLQATSGNLLIDAFSSKDENPLLKKVVRVHHGMDPMVDSQLVVESSSSTLAFPRVDIVVKHQQGSGLPQPLGVVALDPFSMFSSSKGSMWLPLISDVTVMGTLEVEYEHNFIAIQGGPATPAQSALFTIEVVQARGLIPRGGNDIPQTQVVLGVGEHRFSTRPAAASLNPIFHEGSQFTLTNQTIQQGEDVRVQVVDASTFVVIGAGFVSLRSLFDSESHSEWVKVFHDTIETGEVLIQSRASVPTAKDAATERKGEQKGLNRQQPNRNFRLTVLSAEKLLGATEAPRVVRKAVAPSRTSKKPQTPSKGEPQSRHHCTPYVRVMYGSSRGILTDVKTQCVPNTLSPIWAEEMEIAHTAGNSLALYVYDSMDEGFLGSCRVAADDLERALQDSPSTLHMTLVNCDVSGIPSTALGNAMQLDVQNGLGVLTIVIQASSSAVRVQDDSSSMVLTVAPQLLRCKAAASLQSITVRYSPSISRSSTAAFAVSGHDSDSASIRFTPNVKTIHVQNPSVVHVVGLNAVGKELFYSSLVASHSTGATNVAELEVDNWLTLKGPLQSDNATEEIGKLLVVTKLLSLTCDPKGLSADVTTLQLTELLGFVSSFPKAAGMKLAIRTSIPGTRWSRQTRSFYPPSIDEAAKKSFAGRSFHISVPDDAFGNSQLDPIHIVNIEILAQKKHEKTARVVAMGRYGWSHDGCADSDDWVEIYDVHTEASFLSSSTSLSLSKQMKNSSSGVLTTSQQPTLTQMQTQPSMVGSPKNANLVGHLSVTRKTCRRWLTGSHITIVRFVSTNMEALGSRVILRFEIMTSASDQPMSITLPVAIRKGDPFVWEPVSLPPGAYSVTAIHLYSVFGNGTETFVGSCREPSLDIHTIGSTMIPFLDGGVVCPHSCLLTNGMIPVTDERGSVVSGLSLNLYLSKVSIPSLPAVPSRLLVVTRDEETQETFEFVTTVRRSGSHLLLDGHNNVVAVELRRSSFSRRRMKISFCSEGAGASPIIIAECAFTLADVCRNDEGPSGTFSVHAAPPNESVEVCGSYNIAFTADKPYERKHKRRGGGASANATQTSAVNPPCIVVQPVRGQQLMIFTTVPKAPESTATPIGDRITLEVVDSTWHLSKESSRVVFRSSSRHGSFPSFLPPEDNQGGAVRVLAEDIKRGECRIVLKQVVDAASNKRVVIGYGQIPAHAAVKARRERTCDVTVPLKTPKGQACGDILLKLYDDLYYDTEILKSMCVLAEVCNIDIQKPLPSAWVLRLMRKVRSGATVQEHTVTLDGRTSFYSFGPFAVDDDRAIEMVLTSCGANNELTPHAMAVVDLSSAQSGCDGGAVHHAVISLLDGNVVAATVKMNLFFSGGAAAMVDLRPATSLAAMNSSRLSDFAHRQRKLERESHSSPTKRQVQLHLHQLEPPAGVRPTCGHRAALWKDEMIVVGGRSSDGTFTTMLPRLSSSTLEWNKRSQAVNPFKREGHAMVRCKDTLYVDGGVGPGGLDVALSSIAGTYEDLRSVYKIAGAPAQVAANTNPSMLGNVSDVSAISKHAGTSISGDSVQSAPSAAAHRLHADPDGYYDTTLAVDLKTRDWRKLRTTGAAKDIRADHSLVDIGNDILVAFGGFGARIVEHVTTQVEDVDGGLTDDLSSMVLPHGVVQRKRKARKQRSYHVVEHLCNDLRCLNLNSLEWMYLEEARDAVWPADIGASCAPCSNGLAGGRGQDWMRSLVRPPPTAAHTAVVVRNVMLVFGGLQASDPCAHSTLGDGTIGKTSFEASPSSALYMLDIGTLKWWQHSSMDAAVSPWPTPRYGHSCCATRGDDGFLVFGGDGCFDQHDLLWHFSVDTLRFTAVHIHHSIPVAPRFRGSLIRAPGRVDDDSSVFVVCGGTLGSASHQASRLVTTNEGDVVQQPPLTFSSREAAMTCETQFSLAAAPFAFTMSGW